MDSCNWCDVVLPIALFAWLIVDSVLRRKQESSPSWAEEADDISELGDMCETEEQRQRLRTALTLLVDDSHSQRKIGKVTFVELFSDSE